MLTTAEKTALLELARNTLKSFLREEPNPKLLPVFESFGKKKGAFVSLHRKDELRGCIGQISPDAALSEVVEHCAVSAASEDTRFLPVTEEELPELTIEISVLTPLHLVKNVEEIEVGKHGLYIVQGYYRGLLLPQVATEYGWDRITFLKHTCRKSGLPENAWKDPETAIYTFEAEVFSE